MMSFIYLFTSPLELVYTPWFVVLCTILLVGLITFFITKNKTYNNDYVTTEATTFSLSAARIMLLLGALMPAITGFLYSLIINELDTTLYINLAFGLACFVVYLMSFSVSFVLNNPNLFIKLFYCLFVLITLTNNYVSHIHPFYFSAMLIAIGIATIIIDRVQPFLYFALTIILCVCMVAFITTNPVVPSFVFIICVLCQILVVYAMILVKLTLSDKLMFADDVLSNGNSIVLAANTKGDIVYVSKSIKNQLGYTEEEVMGQGWWKIRSANPEENTKEQTNIVNVAHEDVVTSKVIAKDGSTRWIKWLNKRMSNGLVVGIGSDVTDQRLLEERYQHMVETVADIIYTTNFNGTFTYTNSAVLAITGFSSADLIGSNYIALIHPNWKEPAAKFYYNQVITKTEKSYYEFPIITKQNAEVWIGQTVTALINTETQRFEGFQTVARDITTRVLAEQKLEENRKRLEILATIVEKILAATTEEDMLTKVLLALQPVVNMATNYGIAMYNLEKNIGVTTYIDINNESKINTRTYNIANRARLEVLQKNEIYSCNNLPEKQELSAAEGKWLNNGIKTIVAIPIFVNGTLYGAINLLHNNANAFTTNQITLLTDIANSIAVNVSRIRYSDIITEINNDVTDNIAYATRIQEAIIPPNNYLTQYLPQSFLYLQQRDKLGGDFYFATQHDEFTFLAVGDCTGHGVSGALLTILSINYLAQAINQLNIVDPALIIEHLNNSVTQSLNKNSVTMDDMRDGLDLSMCVIDNKAKAIFYAGAMNSLYIVHNNTLKEYKGTRMPIGGIIHDYKNNFYETHAIPYVEGMNLYLTTDGYTDQFDPITRKKYSKPRFKELLLAIAQLPIEEQKNKVQQSHNDWKRSVAQTDDICVVGIKL